MMSKWYRTLVRTEKIKRTLDFLAYGSLILDVSIAVVTLVSFNIYSTSTGKILKYLNFALTAEVIVAAVIFVVFILNLNYERIINNLMGLGGARKKVRKWIGTFYRAN